MNKKRWNKCVSLLMAAIMLVTVFVGTNITATAIVPDVEQVDLSVLTDLLLAGSVYTEADYDKSNVAVITGNCTVDSIKWQNGGESLTDGERLYDGNDYYMLITLKANDGEKFSTDATVTVNGEPAYEYLNRFIEDGYSKLTIGWVFNPIVLDYIGSVDLWVPDAVPGNTADPYNYTHTDAGVTYYSVAGEWREYDASSKEYKPMASTDTFRDDGAYELYLKLKAMPGYAFDYSLNVMVNGWSINSFGNQTEMVGGFYVSYGIEIRNVSFTVPEPVVGQSFSNAAPIKATVPSGSNYTVEGNWIDENGNLTGTFAQGKEYHFESKMYANDGYYFARDMEIYVNDSYWGWVGSEGTFAFLSYRSSLKFPISEAVLTNVPKAELGKTLKAGDIAIEVPNGAKYQATAQWLDEYGYLTEDQTAQAGQKYSLEIYLQADDEYEFGKDYILKINGISHQKGGEYPHDMHVMEYSFLEQISQIEVTDLVKPVVGQVPSTDTLTTADPEKYEVVFAEWYDMADYLPATEFEDGHAYELSVMVLAKSGYEFAPYASWSIDGTTDTTSGNPLSYCYLYKTYSFETVIPEVRVSDIPEMKVGESATSDVSVPDGANYGALAEWYVWDENTQCFEPFSGVFEQGKTYSLGLHIFSNSGYRFEEDATVCYLDGVLNEDVIVSEKWAYCQIDCAQQDAKVIQKVELSIAKPLTTNHSSIQPVFTLPENANYNQNMNAYRGWIVGDVDDWWDFNGYFEEDGIYGLHFALNANEGYVFAKDLTVVVNGIIVSDEAYNVRSSKELDGSFFFNMTCQHAFENGKCLGCQAADPNYVPETDNPADNPTDTPADIPQTGDNSNLTLWFALLFISGASILAITLSHRKRAKNK